MTKSYKMICMRKWESQIIVNRPNFDTKPKNIITRPKLIMQNAAFFGKFAKLCVNFLSSVAYLTTICNTP